MVNLFIAIVKQIDRTFIYLENFKNRRIFCDVHSIHRYTVWPLLKCKHFTEIKGDFCVPSTLPSFKIKDQYIVNLIFVVYSAEDSFESIMKL